MKGHDGFANQVLLHSLVGRPDLNGTTGVKREERIDGRLRIDVPGKGEFWICRENTKAVEAAYIMAAVAYYCTNTPISRKDKVAYDAFNVV